MSPDVQAKRLARARRRIELLEGMIEETTRSLFLSNEELRSSLAHIERLQAIMPTAVIVCSSDGTITSANVSALRLLDAPSADCLVGNRIETYWSERPAQLAGIDQEDAVWVSTDGAAVDVLVSTSMVDDAPSADLVIVASDVRERRRLEVELRHAQKLESVGQLAAGVAHEINTPMQFIGDNVAFVDDAVGELMSLVDLSLELAASLRPEEIQAAVDDADLDFLRVQLPKSLQRTVEGVRRVTQIVSAMKAFSHPGSEHAPSDLNAAVETTLTVATSEYRHVADLETSFDSLPSVSCNVGDLNQVFLNLIINAAHAIRARFPQGDQRGVIRVSTHLCGDHVEVRIGDNGSGIPKGVRDRVFDPFFTTKTVGEGTGQGLSLARTIVAERHGGTLSFDTEEGVGTTFIVRVPISGGVSEAAA